MPPPAGDGISTVAAPPPEARGRKGKSVAAAKVDDGAEQETVAVEVCGGYWEKLPYLVVWLGKAIGDLDLLWEQGSPEVLSPLR